MTNGNGGDVAALPTNSRVIHVVVFTVCLASLICVGTQAFCYINRVPDMNTPLSSAFIHVTDTIIGAVIAMLINTRPQPQQPPITQPATATIVSTLPAAPAAAQT